MMNGIQITILPGGKVQVKANPWIPKFVVDNFVRSKANWIAKHVAKMSKVKIISKESARAEFVRLKPMARTLVTQRLEHYNQHYHHKWTSIKIRDQSTRWGSCNRLGHLSFNYRLATIPPELADYVVVHELCHLKQLNHSDKFWDLVGETLPNYATSRKRLREFGTNKID